MLGKPCWTSAFLRISPHLLLDNYHSANVLPHDLQSSIFTQLPLIHHHLSQLSLGNLKIPRQFLPVVPAQALSNPKLSLLNRHFADPLKGSLQSANPMSAEADVQLKDFENIFKLDGKVAVVTGGTRGLGLHAASGYVHPYPPPHLPNLPILTPATTTPLASSNPAATAST
jgi:hypothetical protein